MTDLQNQLDRWSNEGFWEKGTHGMNYSVRYCIPVVVSCGCKLYHNVTTLEYKWSIPSLSNSSSSIMAPFYGWSEEFMCQTMSGHNVLIVGDSINEHLFFYWGMLATQNQDRVVQSFDYGNYLNINCSLFRLPSFGLSFARSDRLRIGDGISVRETQEMNKVYHDSPWIHLIARRNITLLLLNRGAHFAADVDVLNNLNITLQHVTKTYPNVTIFYRNTPSGHPNCDSYRTSPPLLHPLDLTVNNSGPHHWSEFYQQNVKTSMLILHDHPTVYLLDVVTPTSLRADHHNGFGDCLHYCPHSVMDHWILLFVNAIALLRSLL